ITDLAYYTRVEKTLKRLIDSLKPPAAVCFFRPFNARLAIQLCQDRGLHVPQDISILTYQDLRAVTEIPPQISSIDDNYEAVGYEAAAMLDRMMNGQAESEVLYVPPRGIHARTTTDYYAVEDPLVAEALRYITEHLSEKVRAHDVAYELAVSVSTLQKRFAKAIGRGMGEETLRLRLSSVKVMLAEPELTLATIATRTGFASAVVLSHAFKRAFGVTPGAYRKLVTARD
ncbi:MAG: substrate-binding domain-containing protein, partial [Phycisphaeraceae bacterium]